ncbi:hypothetical protein CPB85DRAFT_1456586 [Mucidula mucida]|nr:hypothetical protein CPB85DRAFT_1456586 [Mucidula mucida]
MSPPTSPEMDYPDDSPESPPPSEQQQLPPQTPGPKISSNRLPTFPTTPHAHSSAAHAAFDDDKELSSNSLYQNHDEYIEHDLQNNRVFMHAEKFMELVFRTPANWKANPVCKGILAAITANDDFKAALESFREILNGPGTEHRLYPPIVALYAIVLTLLDAHDPLPDGDDRKTLKLAFSVNDPVELVDAVTKGLSPDIRSLFGSFTIHEKELSFSNVVHVVEVEDTDSALCRGANDFRVLHNGADPLQKSRGRETKQASAPNSGQPSPAASVDTKASRKRTRTDDDAEGSNSSQKINRSFSASRKAQSTEAPTPKTQVDPQTQCARYAMEHLSNAILRSHSILTLFDKDRFQFEYFDRSVIAVSSAVELLEEEGQRLFILMVYGLRRLSPEDLGLREVVQDSLKFCTNYKSASKHVKGKTIPSQNGPGKTGPRDWRKMFYNREITIQDDVYTLKEIVFRQPGLIGRTTCVIAATKNGSDNERFVVKISYPTTTRVPEMELIRRARMHAESDEKHAWVLNHLPNMTASMDIEIGKNTVQARMRDFLKSAEYANEKTYFYEDRCLRICVSEELHAITSLTSSRKIGQVFLDILQTHQWLYTVPKILHRDLSMSNIMVREDGPGNVYGVPNDLDLASQLSEVDAESESTLMRRTGTPPFMAFDLQDPHNLHVLHLYRHDLESLFYVLLMLVCRHEIDQKKGSVQQLRSDPPFEDWFDWSMSWSQLQATKVKFFHSTDIEVIKSQISPSFRVFEEWVVSLWKVLGGGFAKRHQAKTQLSSFSISERLNAAIKAGHIKPPPLVAKQRVDDETLDGEVTYWTFMQYMNELGNKDLKIRCDDLGL